MILSGEKIKRCVEEGQIGIEPFLEKNIKGASYTFTLDNKIRCLKNGQTVKINEKPDYEEFLIPGDGYVLEPGKFILGFTKEKLKLNGRYGCLLSARGSCAQIGLSADHDEYVWINPEDFRKYNVIENIVPMIESYLELKK